MTPTILLIQSKENRTYINFESINACMEGLATIYEEHLYKTSPVWKLFRIQKFNIVYSWFNFIESLKDISVLVYQKDSNMFAPNKRDWIKEKMHKLIQRQHLHNNPCKKTDKMLVLG